MDDLLIITKLKKTILYIDKTIENYPKNYNIIKNNIEINIYNILELTYKCIYNKDRIDILYEILVKIKMLDFYLRLCLDKKIINYKKYINICTYLNEITKMIFGWIKNEKKKHKI